MDLFQTGMFTAHSGDILTWKIECDVLSDTDIDCLAAVASRALPGPFCEVYGIPRGGVRLAHAMKRYVDTKSGTLLIVDDVLTTGGSMYEAYTKSSGPIHGLVMFARGRVPDWITALWTLHEDAR